MLFTSRETSLLFTGVKQHFTAQGAEKTPGFARSRLPNPV
jgi:hypothetical protein